MLSTGPQPTFAASQETPTIYRPRARTWANFRPSFTFGMSTPNTACLLEKLEPQDQADDSGESSVSEKVEFPPPPPEFCVPKVRPFRISEIHTEEL